MVQEVVLRESPLLHASLTTDGITDTFLLCSSGQFVFSGLEGRLGSVRSHLSTGVSSCQLDHLPHVALDIENEVTQATQRDIFRDNCPVCFPASRHCKAQLPMVQTFPMPRAHGLWTWSRNAASQWVLTCRQQPVARAHDGHHEDGHHDNEQQLPQFHRFPASLLHTSLKTEFYGHPRLRSSVLTSVPRASLNIKLWCQREVRVAPFRGHSGLNSTREAGNASVGHRMPQIHFPVVVHRDFRNPRLRSLQLSEVVQRGNLLSCQSARFDLTVFQQEWKPALRTVLSSHAGAGEDGFSKCDISVPATAITTAANNIHHVFSCCQFL